MQKGTILIILSLSGIALIGTLFLLFTMQENLIEFEITELKDKYKQGDMVTISVNYDGKKFDCHTPKILVTNKTNTNQIFAENNNEQIKNEECPNVWELSFYPGFDRKPFSQIESPQSYIATVSLGDKTLQKEFTVYPDPNRKFYTDIQINNLDRKYDIGNILNFTISVRGYGVLDAGQQPQVQIQDKYGSTIWNSREGIVLCCPVELTEISRDIPLSTLGEPVKIDLAGTYTIIASYNGKTTQKSFEVILPEKECGNIPEPATKIQLKKYTWIAVSQIRQQFNADCVIVDDLISNIPKLEQAMSGANGCYDGTIQCTIPKGVGVEISVLDSDVHASESDQYKLSLSDDEAKSIIKKIGITSQEAHKILKHNDKYYLLFFYSEDHSPNSDVMMEFDTPIRYVPVKLEKGQSINYTITVKTLSTFGKQKAKIDFIAGNRALDSRLDVKIDPNHLELGEREQAKINMIISASKDVRNGVYQTWVHGKTGGSYIGPWDPSAEFPIIQIGNSEWIIINPDGHGGNSMGGKSPPEWLGFEIKTDQNFYKKQNQTEIKILLINKSDQKITLDNNRDLMITISGPLTDNSVKPIYGIRAYSFDTKTPIVLEPNSELVLARPFLWNQTTFSDSQQMPNAEPGIYIVESFFNGYASSVFYSQKRIGIGLNNTSSALLEIPSDDSFSGMTIKIPQNASTTRSWDHKN